jgi:hypothetical protein
MKSIRHRQTTSFIREIHDDLNVPRLAELNLLRIRSVAIFLGHFTGRSKGQMTPELANNRAARPRNNYSLLWVFENSRVQVIYNLYVHVPGNSSETRVSVPIVLESI